MDDPTVVPWVSIWIGLVLAVSGGVLAIWSVVRYHRPVAERIGLAALAVGVTLIVGTLLVNGGAFITKACIDSMHSQQQTYHDPDH